MTLVTQAARANVPVIAITGSGFSPLARDAKIWFKVTEANFEGFVHWSDGRFLSAIAAADAQKGSRNKIGEDFLQAMLADFEQHGEAVIAKVRETKPDVYLRVVADLLPKELKLDRDPLENLTDEQLMARLEQVRRQTDPFMAKYREDQAS